MSFRLGLPRATKRAGRGRYLLGSNGPTSIVDGRPGPLQGGGETASSPLPATVPLPMWMYQSGAARPCGHQFPHRRRKEADLNGARVTTGHPAGCDKPFAFHAGGEALNLRPDVIARPFPYNVIAGVPRSVHVVLE